MKEARRRSFSASCRSPNSRRSTVARWIVGTRRIFSGSADGGRDGKIVRISRARRRGRG